MTTPTTPQQKDNGADAEREHSLFQKEMLKMGIKENFLERSKLGDDGYQHPIVHERWIGFHACYSLAPVGTNVAAAIPTWQERLRDDGGRYGTAENAMQAEIADLRAAGAPAETTRKKIAGLEADLADAEQSVRYWKSKAGAPAETAKAVTCNVWEWFAQARMEVFDALAAKGMTPAEIAEGHTVTESQVRVILSRDKSKDWTFAAPASQAVSSEAVAWCVANPNGEGPSVLIYGNGAALKPGDRLYLATNAAAPATAPDVAKDAARYRWLCDNNFDRQVTQIQTWVHTWEPHSQTGDPTEWKARVRGGALDRAIDAAMGALPPAKAKTGQDQ